MAHRRCVVTLATDHKQYPASLDRLEASLAKVGFEGELAAWRGGRLPEGCPEHADVPFAFKPYCLAEAARGGGGLLLWLDAACIAVRSLDPVFARIERDGYVLFRNRAYLVGEWASDAALETFGLSRDDAMSLPEVNAAVVGLNVDSDVGAGFLERWLAAAGAGLAFRGVPEPLVGADDYGAVKWNRDGRVSSDPRVRGHRHDQTVAGLLAAQLGMSLTGERPGGLLGAHGGDRGGHANRDRPRRGRGGRHPGVARPGSARSAARDGRVAASVAVARPPMRFLADERLYRETEHCLRWLRELPREAPYEQPGLREPCHLYWRGSFTPKQAFAVKSFLATQDLERTDLWLWLDGEDGYAGHEENRFLRPLLPHLRVKRFDLDVEAAGTPVERRPDLYHGLDSVKRSDLFRFVVLFRYGGLYADMDTMFLRDVHELPPDADEFCSRWSANVPHANTAFCRLRKESDTARQLLVRCAREGQRPPAGRPRLRRGRRSRSPRAPLRRLRPVVAAQGSDRPLPRDADPAVRGLLPPLRPRLPPEAGSPLVPRLLSRCLRLSLAQPLGRPGASRVVLRHCSTGSSTRSWRSGWGSLGLQAGDDAHGPAVPVRGRDVLAAVPVEIGDERRERGLPGEVGDRRLELARPRAEEHADRVAGGAPG